MTEKQTHTPGPWEVCNGTDVYPVGDLKARHFIADCDPDGAPLENDGEHHNTDATYAEAKANARLIAQAPAMLSAAKGVLNYATLDDILSNPKRHENEVFGIRLGDLRKLRDAIAAATGEAP
ncbi:MAG: hypothetical protein RLW68_00980 [Devosia marina]|uniref:hypothetical protein n=1 Tax=Devosia marina TaxID=2683198 RepID=UPI0032ECFA84